MDYHIIAILGKAGDKDKLASYSKDSDLKISELFNGEFINSTHCLMESFGESATYTFLGTSESIKHHKDIFVNLSQCKAIFDKYPPIESSDIEDIFHQILESIKSAHENNIILDITHGFRHQPIIASFASTLGQINTKKSITLLFAKEIERQEKYQYISLEKYSQISLIALSLQTFVQTLSVPNMGLKEPFIIALSEFSKSLHANAFNEIFANLDKAKSALQNAKNSDSFKGLDNILSEVEFILSIFDDIKTTKENYNKYYKFARLMHTKRYYLISATYIYESIALYIIEHLYNNNLITIDNFTEYDLSNAVRYFVLTGKKPNDTKNGGNIFGDDVDNFKKATKHKKNHQIEFDTWKQLIYDIKNLRNDLAHISKDTRHNIDIRENINKNLQALERIINNKSTSIIKNL